MGLFGARASATLTSRWTSVYLTSGGFWEWPGGSAQNVTTNCMTMKPVVLTLLFVLFSSVFLAQKLSPVDSVRLFATWKKTADFIRINDTTKLRTLCLDSIDCKLCGFRDDTITDTEKPLSIFFKHGLDKINSNQKLWKIIDSETPDLIVSGYIDKNGDGERFYSIAYLFWKPNELAKDHEGAQVVFDFVLRKNKFKLFRICTVP